MQRVDEAEAAEIPEERCQELLAYLREHRDSLDPAPIESLETLIDSWFELAETSFFECPPKSGEFVGWSSAFAELALLEEEIETVLDSQA